MRVVLISSPGCQPCRISKKILHDNGVEFTERNVAEDPEALELAKSLGHATTPIIIAGDDHWSGLDPDRLKRLAA